MPYLKSLTRELREMWVLVLSQHQKSLTALVTFDKDLAREIILMEERVNSCEQFIESDCQHYFSLPGSKTSNISFAMYALKTTRYLEILGDLASKIASDILTTPAVGQRELVIKSNIAGTFDRSNKIIELTMQAFEENDGSLAQVALNRIAVCQEMVVDSNHLLAHYLKTHTDQYSQGLHLFSVLENLKRILEVTQNISVGILKYNNVTAVQV
ncbi:MAG: phosphate signaling complex PhoU family protein [Flavisolibacter sp.]